ncbi:MAG: hypothetical protein ACREU8_07790 [Gammaproteobacteria bacterium]
MAKKSAAGFEVVHRAHKLIVGYDILDEIAAPDAVIHSTTVPDLSRGPEG